MGNELQPNEEYFNKTISRIENVVKNNYNDSISNIIEKIRKLLSKENSTTLMTLNGLGDEKKLSYENSNLMSWELSIGNNKMPTIFLYEFKAFGYDSRSSSRYKNLPLFNKDINIKSLIREARLNHIINKK